MTETGLNTVRIGGEVKHITDLDAPTCRLGFLACMTHY